jgi:DNA-binding MarR family transcriptional regulator
MPRHNPLSKRAASLARRRADNLRQLLLRASRAINEDVTAALRVAGFKELKNSQVFCLAHIDLEGTSVIDLAARSHVSKQAASKLVGELVALGYLTTSRAQADGRSIVVQFTQQGHLLMQRSFELFADLERDYHCRLGAQTYRSLKRALRVLGERTLDEPKERATARVSAAPSLPHD